jgi:hypothetical protein
VRPEGLCLYCKPVKSDVFRCHKIENVCSIESTLVMVAALTAGIVKMKYGLAGCDTT